MRAGSHNRHRLTVWEYNDGKPATIALHCAVKGGSLDLGGNERRVWDQSMHDDINDEMKHDEMKHEVMHG